MLGGLDLETDTLAGLADSGTALAGVGTETLVGHFASAVDGPAFALPADVARRRRLGPNGLRRAGR